MTPYDQEWDSWADTDPSDGDGDGARTQTLNTYKVTFSVTLEIDAASAQDAEELGFSDFVENLPRPKDFGAYVELIDGTEPGEEPELDTVTCSECGRVGSEAAACWLMATPVCPECFVGPAA